MRVLEAVSSALRNGDNPVYSLQPMNSKLVSRFPNLAVIYE